MPYLLTKFSKYICLSSSLVLMGLINPVQAFQLDFTMGTEGNLTNGNADNNGATLRFLNVGTEGGTDLDLLVTVLDTYAGIANRNGAVSGLDAGQINIQRGTSSRLGFQIVEQGTNTLFTPTNIEFDIYDLDANIGRTNSPGDSREFITLLTEADYEVSNPNTLDITTTADSVNFTSTNIATIDNPTDLSDLTSGQEDISVSLQFSNVSEFELILGEDHTTAGEGVNRNIFFTSDLAFTDPTTTTNFTPVPFEFSPTLGLMLSGLGMLGLQRFRKQRVLNSEN